MNIFFNIILTIILTFSFIVFFSKIALIYNLIDQPSIRKNHKGNIPLIGGVSIYFCLLIIMLLNYNNFEYLFIYSFFCSFLLIIIGVIDDKFEIGVIVRIFTQFLTASLVIGAGITVNYFGSYNSFVLELGFFKVFFSILCFIYIINAFNFIDGADGLCSGLTISAFLSFSAYVLIVNQESMSYVYPLLLIVFSIFVFLIFNFKILPFNRVFLGDAGSTFLGFIVGCCAVILTYNYNLIDPTLTIWAIAIPVYDLMGVIIRRISKKTNPFMPDRRHIHHILMNEGISSNLIFFSIIFSSILLSFIGAIVFFLFGPLISFFSYILCFLIYTFVLTDFKNRYLKYFKKF